MALSDSDKRKHVPSKRSRPIGAETNRNWSDAQKIEAVKTYLALGEVRLTANVLKIPEVTLHNWKSKEWWKELERELRLQDDLQLSARLQKIISRSLSEVEDRLSNGDFLYDQKTGKFVRKPVSLKDAHKVAMDMVDKRDVLNNKMPVSQTLEAVEDKLDKLAAKFAEMANRRRPAIEVTDVIIGQEINQEDEPDALYEERQEGLQEGK